MNYVETLDWLLHVETTRGWDLKLESVREALDRLGRPERAFASLHVAGTNGKGSTVAIAAAVLEECRLRVGVFTSPHLVDFRERIRVNGEWIPRDSVVALAGELRERLAGSGIELTFFEISTAIAFLHFARCRIDVAVVEVGLGGRLDATNVLEPRATAVTTIAFDHERWLGTTLADIAREKAGIWKPGIPAVAGRSPDEATAVLEAVAAEQRAPLRRLGREFHVDARGDAFDWRGRRTIGELRLGLRGAFQRDNAAVALALLEDAGLLDGADDGAVRRALAAVRWPGRLEIVRESPRVVLDGAHNPAGVEALVRELPGVAVGPIHLVFGVLADKRWTEMVECLAPHVASATVVPVRERRAEDPDEVARAFAARVPTLRAPSGAEAVRALVRDPRGRDGTILVAGSLFLVGEVRQALGVAP